MLIPKPKTPVPSSETSLSAANPVAADPTYFLPKVEANRLLEILLRRGWLVVFGMLAGTAALYWFAGTLPKIYKSSGSVQINSQAPFVMNIQAVAPEETKDLEEMRSVEQGMIASTLLLKVIEANGLAKDPAFAPARASEAVLRATLAKRVSVALRRGTRFIDITVEDTDPKRAKLLVESLVTEYEKWTFERQQQVTQQASDGLAREQVRLNERMLESAAKVQEFRKNNPISGLEGTEGGLAARDSVAMLNSQLDEARAARLRLEAEFEAFSKFDSSDPQALSGLETSERGTEVIAQVRALKEKENDFGKIKERYLFKHPVYKEMANEIELLKTNLAETVQAAGQSLEQRYKVAQENELKLASELAQARTEAVETEGVRAQYRSITREADADRTLHDQVALRLRETSLAASVPTSVLSWRDQPITPEAASSPRKAVFAAAGMLLGFFGGLALLTGLEMSDHRIRNSAAAARATGSPLLVTLPAVQHSGDGMVVLSDPNSAGAEAFRRLRVILAPPPGSSTARTVLFASAKSGEGKSFCALNYATSLAIQGHRTLLFDADLRTPGLSRMFLDGGRPDSGLGGFLASKIDPAETCFATSLPNLYLLSSGPLRTDAAELLGGTRFPALLEDAFRWFDRVVIDTPSVLSVSDMLSLARYADRTCLVVRENCSDSRELKRAADLIRSSGGNLFGYVWNNFTADKSARLHSPFIPTNQTYLAEVPNPVGSQNAKFISHAVPSYSSKMSPSLTS